MAQNTLDDSVVDFTRAVGLLLRRVRAASSHELSWTESLVMARLAREGPATIADLARAEGIKPQSMGTTVAALEEQGLVERKAHPTDGRQSNIALTTKGLAVRKSAKDAKQAWLAQAITQLSEQDRALLFKAGEVIERLARQ